MARGDGTGPMGAGPRLGRSAGYCAGFNVPGYMNPNANRGRGGRGLGRGLAGGGRGLGIGQGKYGPNYVNPFSGSSVWSSGPPK